MAETSEIKTPVCFDLDDATFGGECYFNQCKHHAKDEPLCTAPHSEQMREEKE